MSYSVPPYKYKISPSQDLDPLGLVAKSAKMAASGKSLLDFRIAHMPKEINLCESISHRISHKILLYKAEKIEDKYILNRIDFLKKITSEALHMLFFLPDLSNPIETTIYTSLCKHSCSFKAHRLETDITVITTNHPPLNPCSRELSMATGIEIVSDPSGDLAYGLGILKKAERKSEWGSTFSRKILTFFGDTLCSTRPIDSEEFIVNPEGAAFMINQDITSYINDLTKLLSIT